MTLSMLVDSLALSSESQSKWLSSSVMNMRAISTDIAEICDKEAFFSNYCHLVFKIKTSEKCLPIKII